MAGISLWQALVLGVLLVSSHYANAATASPAPPANDLKMVEVPIAHVFVPEVGFDDNDNVEVVLDGVLPNGCYSIGNADVQVKDAHRITARLFAKVQTLGVCADQDKLPLQLRPPVPYTITQSLGTLPMGDYRVFFPRPLLTEGIRTFNVAHAKTMSVDDYPYAAVSGIWIGDLVRGDQNMQATLVGSMTADCSLLTQTDIHVRREDDVYVIEPVLEFKPNVLCAFVMSPFERQIDLGRAAAGRYLLHVRSMNGNAVSRAFSVVDPGPLPGESQ